MSQGNDNSMPKDLDTRVTSECRSFLKAELEECGCTDAHISEGMHLAAQILRDIRGIQDFSDEQLLKVFMEFIDGTLDEDPDEALLEMKLRLWGSDRSRWPQQAQDTQDLGTVSAERVSKAKTFLGAGSAGVGGALLYLGAVSANPVLIVAGAAAQGLGVGVAESRKTAELPRSPLAMTSSNWERLDIVERGNKTHFTWLVKRGGQQWTISRTRKDFKQLRISLAKRLQAEKSGTYPLTELFAWPSRFHSSKSLQVRLDAWLWGIVDSPLSKSILAETIYAFFQPTHEDSARFGPAVPVSSKAALAAASRSASNAPSTSRSSRESSEAAGESNAASGSGNDVAAPKKGKSSRWALGR